MSLLHLNARSLSKNFDSLQTLLCTLNFPFSIIGISETWLNKNSPPVFNIPNYDMIRADRKAGRGGGVAYYIHDSISFRLRDDVCINGTEDLFIEVERQHSKNIIIGLVYRPPNHQFQYFYDNLETSLNKLSLENKDMYLMGDFNINISDTSNQYVIKFLDLLASHALFPSIDKPTRITPDSLTLIDNIFCNVTNKNNVSGLLYHDISDHLPIFLLSHKYTQDTMASGKTLYRKETQDNIANLINDLSHEEWLDILNQSDTEIAYDKFLTTFLNYYKKNIPLIHNKSSKRKTCQPWITNGILNSIKKRNRLYKNYLRDSTPFNLEKYKKFRNKLTCIIRESRKMYYSDKLRLVKGNLTTTWKIINELIGKKKKSKVNSISENNKKITNPKDIASAFNSYFVNAGPNLARKINCKDKNFSDFLHSPSDTSLFFTPTDTHEIIKIVKSLKNSNSSGHDEITTKLLKQIITDIAPPLMHIFNLSLSNGVYPNSFKIAKVIAIFKKDDPSQISNYRPISLLPCISKILEKIVYKRLYSFLIRHKLLIPNQFGFRKGFSTDLALVNLFDAISNSLAKKENVVGIFMDLSKAFDTLNHDILLYKLQTYGIRGVTLLWFKNYLSNRSQYVTYNNYSSQTLPVTCGVPQGSILGPLLFLIYINDIINSSSKLSYILFADDTTISYSHKSLNVLQETLNHELTLVSQWFRCNKLSLNIKKTNFIHFKTHSLTNVPIDINIKIDNIFLEKKTSTKFLGVILDDRLSWKYHFDYISSSISRGTGILRKLKDALPNDVLFMLYNTLVLPYINYCNIVWGNGNITFINNILKLQKRALRICTGSHYLAHSDPLFHKLHSLKINDINVLQTAVFMFKLNANLLPTTFDKLFSHNKNIHHYPTRVSDNFHLSNPLSSLASRSIRHYGPDIWNSLPESLKSSPSDQSSAQSSVYVFKNSMKTYLLSKYTS